jgi:hypothetical protein
MPFPARAMTLREDGRCCASGNATQSDSNGRCRAGWSAGSVAAHARWPLETSKTRLIAGWEEGIACYLLERLAAALKLIEPSAAERSRQLTEWNKRLDALDSAADGIERQLECHYAQLSGAKRDQHLVYLANNEDRIHYVSLSSSRLPIGSGVSESAAKNRGRPSRQEQRPALE